LKDAIQIGNDRSLLKNIGTQEDKTFLAVSNENGIPDIPSL
jgi:hypothetical protein